MRETTTLAPARSDAPTTTIPAARALVPVEPPGQPVAASQPDVLTIGVSGLAGYYAAQHVGFNPWLGAILGAMWAAARRNK